MMPSGEAMRPPPLAIRACACFKAAGLRTFGYPRQRRGERRVAAFIRKCGNEKMVPPKSTGKNAADERPRENLCYLAVQRSQGQGVEMAGTDLPGSIAVLGAPIDMGA